ncbi:MAG TPA: sterol desaturase family protein [Planctomycetaceae bacterium]|nr:sterol desaturase family protein [Planctomycetaceae bacterium]
MRGSWLSSLSALILANAAVLLVASALLPAHASAILQCYARTFASFGGSRLTIALTILAACLLVEMRWLGWQNSALRKLLRPSRSTLHDLILGMINLSGFSVVLFLFFTAGVFPVAAGESRRWVAVLGLRPLDSPVLQFAMTLLVREFLGYWFHRGMHTFAFAWEAHKYHHAATEFTMLTASRHHIVETALSHLFLTLPLVFLGMTGDAFVAITIASDVLGRFNHSRLDWRFGWWGRWLLVSPVTHRIHHSPQPEHWDKNFSNNLLIWDRLFGTWYAGETVNAVVGVSDNYFERETVVGGYVNCYRLAVSQFLRSLFTNEWLLSTRRQRRMAQNEPQLGPEIIDHIPGRRAA